MIAGASEESNLNGVGSAQDASGSFSENDVASLLFQCACPSPPSKKEQLSGKNPNTGFMIEIMAICQLLSNLGGGCYTRCQLAWRKADQTVLTVFELARFLGITPCGKHDLFIRQQEEPGSKRMQNKCLLCIAQMVLTVQIVAGVLFLGTTFGP